MATERAELVAIAARLQIAANLLEESGDLDSVRACRDAASILRGER